MTKPRFQIVALDVSHDKRARGRFNSGSDSLDSYFKQRVTQDVRRDIATCFVAIDDDGRIAGYNTLSSTSVLLTDLPEKLKKKLPRYPLVPAARIGRLAVDRDFQGKGLGAAMLADALLRLYRIRSELAVYALVVDAKDESATGFYLHLGFIPVSGDRSVLFLPIATAHMILKNIDA